MKFGFLNDKGCFIADKIEIKPLGDIDRSINWLKTQAKVSDGWIYPPMKPAKKSNREKHSEEFDVFSEYFTIEPTHEITMNPYDSNKAKFIILGVGFFFGVYLSPAGYYNLGKTPYEEGKLTGVIPVGDDISKAIDVLSQYYDTNPQKRTSMFAVLHWFMIGQSHTYPWDRFEAQYKVLDGLYKISESKKAPTHAFRPIALAGQYGIQLPNWAALQGKSSKLTILRNELAHEAIYAGHPIGYAHPGEDYDLELASFNVKLIASSLGVKSAYLQIPVHDRQYHLWNIE